MAVDGRTVDEIIDEWGTIAAKVERPAESKKAKKRKGRSLQSLRSFISKSISDPLPKSSSSANVSAVHKEKKYTPDEAKEIITEDLFKALAIRAKSFEKNLYIQEEIKEIINSYYTHIAFLSKKSRENVSLADLYSVLKTFERLKQEDDTKFAEDRCFIPIVAMFLYVDTFNSIAGWLRQDESISKRLLFVPFWPKDILSIRSKGHSTIKDNETEFVKTTIVSIFRIAFCNEIIQQQLMKLIVKKGFNYFELKDSVSNSLATILFSDSSFLFQEKETAPYFAKLYGSSDQFNEFSEEIMFSLFPDKDSSSDSPDLLPTAVCPQNFSILGNNPNLSSSLITQSSNTNITNTSEEYNSEDDSLGKTDDIDGSLEATSFDSDSESKYDDSITEPLLGHKSTPSSDSSPNKTSDSLTEEFEEIDLNNGDKKEEKSASTPPITRALSTVSSEVYLLTPQKKSGSTSSPRREKKLEEEKEQKRLKELWEKEAKERERKEEQEQRRRREEQKEEVLKRREELKKREAEAKRKHQEEQKRLKEAERKHQENLQRCKREDEYKVREELQHYYEEEQENSVVRITANGDGLFKNMRRYLIAEMVVNSSSKTPINSASRSKEKEKEKDDSDAIEIQEAAAKLLTHTEWANHDILATLDNLTLPSTGHTYTEDKIIVTVKEACDEASQSILTRTKSYNQKKILATTLTNNPGNTGIDIVIAGKSEAVKEEVSNIATLAKMFCEDNCLIIETTGNKIGIQEYCALILFSGIIPIFAQHEENDNTTSIWKTFKDLYDNKDLRKVSEQYLDEILKQENSSLKQELLIGMFSTISSTNESDKTVQYQDKNYTLDDLTEIKSNALIKAIIYSQIQPGKQALLMQSASTNKKQINPVKNILNHLPAFFSFSKKGSKQAPSDETPLIASIREDTDEEFIFAAPSPLPPVTLTTMTRSIKK